MKFKDAIKEFLNTFQELHYFISGLALGNVFGWVTGCYFTLKLVEVL